MRAASITNFDRLPIPYRAVATDLESGQAFVIGHGNLVRAMRASMAVPGVFTPVEWDGRILVDGGVVNNLPVDVVRAMGAEIVIAVDVGSESDKVDKEKLSRIGGILGTGRVGTDPADAPCSGNGSWRNRLNRFSATSVSNPWIEWFTRRGTGGGTRRGASR